MNLAKVYKWVEDFLDFTQDSNATSAYSDAKEYLPLPPFRPCKLEISTKGIAKFEAGLI